MTNYSHPSDFFDEGLTLLGDNYYATHPDEQCYICQEEDKDVIDPYSRLAVRVTACSHVFHQNCLREWVTSSYAANNMATCPMCRSVLASCPPTVDSPLQAQDTQAHSRRMLPGMLLDEVERLNARVNRTDAEQHQLYLRIIRIAGLMDAVGLYVDHAIVADMTELVGEYERSHRLRFLWQGVQVRSRSLLRRA